MGRNKQHLIRCYALKRGGEYFTGCPALNLTGTGSTLQDSKNSLENNIRVYMETVFNGKEVVKYEEVKHLLRRSAPIYMYFDLSICFIKHYIYKMANNLNNSFIFEERIPELCVSNAY